MASRLGLGGWGNRKKSFQCVLLWKYKEQRNVLPFQIIKWPKEGKYTTDPLHQSGFQ